jgi:hypothetical protein
MIKNYTSETPAVRSVNHIEQRLVQNKAKSIMKTYSPDGILAAIAFIIPTNGQELPFKLPARVDRVEKTLLFQVRRPRKETYTRIKQQAERTAWKILADWVDIQMALVELDQAEISEVFMPYLYNHKKETTFFDQWKNNGFTMIEDKRA